MVGWDEVRGHAGLSEHGCVEGKRDTQDEDMVLWARKWSDGEDIPGLDTKNINFFGMLNVVQARIGGPFA